MGRSVRKSGKKSFRKGKQGRASDEARSHAFLTIPGKGPNSYDTLLKKKRKEERGGYIADAIFSEDYYRIKKKGTRERGAFNT